MAQPVRTGKDRFPKSFVAVMVFLSLLALGAACVTYVCYSNSGDLVIESTSDSTIDSQEDEDDDALENVVATTTVHVDGAVANPGIVVLELDVVRVNDAVAAAGGVTQDADLTSINLAAIVSDGSKIYIPREGESVTVVSAGSTTTSSDTSNGLVNINTATLDELCTLNGVGEATAQAIIDEREANGAFASVEDLVRVSGIGEKKLAKLKPYVCV